MSWVTLPFFILILGISLMVAVLLVHWTIEAFKDGRHFKDPVFYLFSFMFFILLLVTIAVTVNVFVALW